MSTRFSGTLVDEVLSRPIGQLKDGLYSNSYLRQHRYQLKILVGRTNRTRDIQHTMLIHIVPKKAYLQRMVGRNDTGFIRDACKMFDCRKQI